MDGFAKRLNESVQRKLAFTLLLAIALVAGVAGVFSFVSALDEAHELQDDVLRQVAALASRQPLAPDAPAREPRAVAQDEEMRVIVQRLGGPVPTAPAVDAGAALPLPATLADGLHTLTLAGESYRVLVRAGAGGERIAVAQASAFRDHIATDIALRTVLPFVVLVPVLLLVAADLVRKMLRPIAVLAGEVDRRAAHDLDAIDERGVPLEVRPFVVAINRLLGRVDEAMRSQRRFVADAAHELRSPLAALSLQAERLAGAAMSEPARERLGTLRQGIERSKGLLEQLLGLARAQAAAEEARGPQAMLSVQAVYRRVLADLMPLAEAKGIDIGVEGSADAQVRAGEADLLALVRNLVDNAIRYTPPGGRVDLSVAVAGPQALLRIEDNGPGIPPAERERVFDAFYRLPGSEAIGSGLGLSIVRTIAARIGAQVSLDEADARSHRGLRVSVLLARAGTPPCA